MLAMPVEYHGAAAVTSHGAAMCAAVGAGVYADLVTARQAMGSTPEVVSPDRRTVDEYARHYARWLRVAGWLDSLGEEIM